MYIYVRIRNLSIYITPCAINVYFYYVINTVN